MLSDKILNCKLTRLIVTSCEWITHIIDFASADGTVIVNTTISVDAACSYAWINAFLSFTALVDCTFRA